MIIHSYLELVEKMYYENRVRNKDIAKIFGIRPCSVSLCLNRSDKKQYAEYFDYKEFFLSLTYSTAKLANKVLKTLQDETLKIVKVKEGYEIKGENNDSNRA